jgi:hypothetical protein
VNLHTLLLIRWSFSSSYDCKASSESNLHSSARICPY